MKTRVMQDGPDEPADYEDRAVVPAERKRPRNLAARMGRWSAQHPKKAIFGWLAFAIVLFASSQMSPLTTTAPAFKAAVQAVIVGVSRLDAVAKVESPYNAGNSGFVSADKRSALVRIEIRGPSEDAGDKIDPIVARVADVQKAHPGLYVG